MFIWIKTKFWRKGRAICLALFLLPNVLMPAVHYLNQGQRYHLGDDKLNTTADKAVVTAHPKVGTLWEQDFIASQDDQVEVILERLWGVDAAHQRMIEVMVDGVVIGEINKGETGPWRSVLKANVVKGSRHTLAILTKGLPDPDDFVFEGVQVRSYNGARLEAVGEARILGGPVKIADVSAPKNFAAERKGVEGPKDQSTEIRRSANCGIYGAWSKWRPKGGKGSLVLSVGQDRSVESDPLTLLPIGRTFKFHFKIKALPHSAQGKHRLDIQAGSNTSDAWYFEIEDASKKNKYTGISAQHLSKYRDDPLEIKSGFNEVVVHYCTEDLIWIKINDKVFTKALRGGKKPKAIIVKVQGIELELSQKGDAS